MSSGSANAKTLVFVYGTLMRGGTHHDLLASATFCGEARTPPHYLLVDLGPYPALVAGGDSRIAGELFEVDADTLDALDDLEGHPDHYRRRRIVLENGIEADAYLLPQQRARGQPIASGNWRR